MEFRPISECLPAWLIDEIELMKSGASAKPAPSDFGAYDHPSPLARPVLQVVSNSRCFDTALPRRAPHRGAVSKHLVLIVDNAHQTSSGARVSSR